MGKETRKELSLEERWEIVGAHKCGMKPATIAKVFGLPYPTVHATANRFKRTGSAQPKKRPGRPQSLDDRDQRVVKRVVLAGRFRPLREITNEVNANLDTSLHHQAVRKYMAKAGFSSRKASKKPLVKKRTPKPDDGGVRSTENGAVGG
jgi:transposase